MNTVLRDKKFLAKAEILAYTGVCLLLIGFLFNRVVNNIGFFLIAVYTLIRIREAKKLLQDPWMNSFVLIAMVPWVSDLLLEGTRFYLYRGDMKLMLPVFPLFFMAWQPSDRDIRRISILFLVLMAVSTVYSMYHYLTDFKNMYMTYKQSGVVLTLSKKDHIRIGWATAVSCLLAADMARKSPFRWSGGLLYLYAAAQFGFLHVLGSKTGLLLLYAGLLIYLIWSLPGQRKWMAAVLIPLMMAVPVIAYKTIPSFEQRVNFIKYDFEYYSRGEYREGLSDANRFYSLMAGKDIIRSHPWLGTGFSRLQGHVNEWYKANRPEIEQKNYFLPTSQIIIYWASAGVAGLLVILFHLIWPLTRKALLTNALFCAFFIPAAGSFTFETHLENQLPLFFYGFFTAFFWFRAGFGRNHSPEGI